MRLTHYCFANPRVHVRTRVAITAAAVALCIPLGGMAPALAAKSPARTDRTPPSAPTGFVAKRLPGGAVRLSWKASRDNLGVSAYDITLNGKRVARVQAIQGRPGGTLSYVIPNAVPLRIMRYRIIAIDRAGNRSAPATASLAAKEDKMTQEPGTLVCAHRGASAAAPENTLAAFRLAVELGADAVELDTTLTSDGVPVVIHDGTVDRTTNGHGSVEEMPLSEIRKLDAGSWKNARFAGEPMPTLEQVFTMARRPFINVELKANSKDVNRLADTVVALIEKHGLVKKVIISSFSGAALERVHADNPAIATGFLYGGKTPQDLPKGITALHPMYPEVTADFIAFAKGKGLEVNVWTVDDPAEMRRLIGLGVNSIITNVPDVLRETLKTSG